MSMVFMFVGCEAEEVVEEPVDEEPVDEEPVDEEPIDEEPIEVIISSAPGEGGVEEEALNNFKDYLEEMSDGRFDVYLYMGGTLGPDEEISQQLQLGEVQIQYAGVSELEMFLGAGNWPFNIPFLFDDRQEAQELLTQELIPQFNEQLPGAADVKLLGGVIRTPRKLTATRPIEHPEDVRGLDIRLPQISEWLIMWEDILGGNAVAMGGGEVFSALQTGMIEAQENPISFIYANSLYEVTEYIHHTDHMLAPRMVYVSTEWLDTLTEQEQEWVFEAGDRAFTEQFERETVIEAELMEELEELGVTFVDIDYDLWQGYVVDDIEEQYKDIFEEDIWEEYIAPRLEMIREAQ